MVDPLLFSTPEEFIEASRPKKMMNVYDIVTRFNEAVFDSTTEDMIKHLRGGGTLPPIIVSESGYLRDGRHRLAAYKWLGYNEILVAIGEDPGSVEGQEYIRKMTDKWNSAQRGGMALGEFEKDMRNMGLMGNKEEDDDTDELIQKEVNYAEDLINSRGLSGSWQGWKNNAVDVLEAWAEALEKFEPTATTSISRIRMMANDLDSFE